MSGGAYCSGPTQCPITAGPMLSDTNSYFSPFHEKRIGHELPRRSICVIACRLPAASSTSSRTTRAGHSRPLPRAATPAEQCGGALPQISRGRDGLELLPHRARLYFDLGAKTAAV